MRLLAAALALGCAAGCVSSEDNAEGAHLIAHITSPVEFDHVIATMDSYAPQDIYLTAPATSYDFDHWEVFGAVQTLDVTVTVGGNAIATGEASHIHYVPAGDGSQIAEITMRLQP